VTLLGGADGANPHHHARSAELSTWCPYSCSPVIVSSSLAKGTSPSCQPDADLLIVITPGIERFEYFRHLARIATGQQPPQSLLEVRALYDTFTFFDDSPAWRQTRGGHRPDPGALSRRLL